MKYLITHFMSSSLAQSIIEEAAGAIYGITAVSHSLFSSAGYYNPTA